MVDINIERWRECLLQGLCDKNEMVGWLKKLFQDSDIRARNVSEIQLGLSSKLAVLNSMHRSSHLSTQNFATAVRFRTK